MMDFNMFRKQFFENLNKQSGWGKEQVKKLFDDTYFNMTKELVQ